MKLSNPQQPAVSFGLFETGLGVIRSLGQQGINVIGVDHKKDIGWYSRYVTPLQCPHPLQQEPAFLDWVTKTFSKYQCKMPAFISSDDLLMAFSRNREMLSQHFRINLVEHSLLEQISDKYQQFLLAQKAGIDVPATFQLYDPNSLDKLPGDLQYPLFIKAKDVNAWRREISGTIKGFLVSTSDELQHQATKILANGVPIVVQEVILGPDTNHVKYCSYTSLSGTILAEFTLRKIRQNPIRFGVGSVVESIHDDELILSGRKLLQNIGFHGVASAEFKRDERDGRLKLIEINPRYWQQNYLATACGVNFPYINYCDLVHGSTDSVATFTPGIKWVNRYMDFDSFLKYRKEGSLTFLAWRRSLKGKKVYMDFTRDDPVPALYEVGFGWKLVKAPWFLIKRIL